MLLYGGALGGARLRVVEVELQTAHLQAVAQDHPERRVLQFLAQSTEHLIARIRPVVICEFLERVALGRLKESPELVFSDEMLGVRDLGLFEHAILVLARRGNPQCAVERSAPALSCS